ncbi:hypothetical protein CROQUDRAFT_48696, partial [Cronartium quercuum f. sp. fusiforme G11]
SVFTKPPKGLPLDFYDVNWFNEALSNSQKQDIADIHSVMFLPDATHSLLGKAHPDKKLSDKKFTQKYWDEATKDYSMEHTVVDVESKDDNEQSDFDSYKGSSIDLDDMDGEGDNNDDQNLVYEEEDNEFILEEPEEDAECEQDQFEEIEKEQYHDDNEEEFEQTTGKGINYLQDFQMMDEDEDDNTCALRFDAWRDA